MADTTEGTAPAKAREKELHIFVNRRRFDRSHGVTETMTGARISSLVGIDAANAVVRRESGPNKKEVDADEEVSIKNGEHFLVTRRVVDAGCD